MKRFKYQITMEVLFKKCKLNKEIEFRLVYFSSVTKTVTNHVFRLEKSFEEILYMIDVWINNESGWIIELIESQYINISTYRPLSESSYMGLPVELRSPRKGLINIKNKDEKYFLWCHVRHINLLNKHPEIIFKNDKKIAEELNYDGIEFPVQQKDFHKIEIKNNIYINVFGYENELIFPIYISDQKCEDSKDLLLLIDNDKSLYVYIKDFNRFLFHRTKNKNKKWFCKSCLQCFSNENILIKHKEICLGINGEQSVKLEEGIIKFENYFKEIPIPFKVYAGFQCNLEKVKCNEGCYTEKIRTIFLVVLLIKLFVLMINLLNQLLYIEAKMQLMNLLKQFMKNINIAKK